MICILCGLMPADPSHDALLVGVLFFMQPLFTWSACVNITFGFQEGWNRIKLVSVRLRKKKKTQQTIRNFRPQWILLSSGCPKPERSFFCLCLIWQQLSSIICCQQNMGTISSLPLLLNCSLAVSLTSVYGMHKEKYGKTSNDKTFKILTDHRSSQTHTKPISIMHDL